MNEHLIEKMNKLNKSVYEMSKESGIPYTTLNELKNKKSSVNKISAEKAYKLCLYLGCSLEELLDDVKLYNGLSGSYNGYKYSWQQSQKQVKVIVTRKGSKEKIEKKFKKIVSKNPYKFAKAYPEVLIDNSIMEREKEKIYESLFVNAQK